MLSRFASFVRPFRRSLSRKNSIDSLLVERREWQLQQQFEHKEYEYLLLLSNILESGSLEMTRTGELTKTLFGQLVRFDLRDRTLPILTTKRVSFRNVLCELFWFMSGDTNVDTLARQNVRIWHGNTSPEYLRSVDLDRRYAPYTDAGPIYSHQWRHYGAEYHDCYTDYKGQGVDQLRRVLHTLRHDPQSRRNILTAWNPQQIGECVLPPCHVMAQFRVLRGRELHCHLTMRSADCALGLPYNICSYAVLTHLLAKLANLDAAELIVSIGDAHLYRPHWELAKRQLSRKPFDFPKVEIDLPDYDPACPIDIDEVSMSSIRLIGEYRHHPKIPYKFCA